MYLYGRKHTILVIGGLVLYHILVFALCVFFIWKFLLSTCDASVFLLLGLLVCPMIICDILAAKMQVFSRFLIRCWTDTKGIHCVRLGKRWNIRWSDICIFGITGFSSITQTGVIFLSNDPSEKYQQDKLTIVTDKRIAFSFDKQRWDIFSIYMPDDIKKKLQKAISNAYDCYYRR